LYKKKIAEKAPQKIKKKIFKKKIQLKMKNFNFYFNTMKFSSNKTTKVRTVDTTNLIKFKTAKTEILFKKEFLLGSMTYNVIYFCVKRRELANLSNILKHPILLTNKILDLTYVTDKFFNFKYFKNYILQRTFKKKLLLTRLANLILKTKTFFYKTFSIGSIF
jgi:hypothetical protein